MIENKDRSQSGLSQSTVLRRQEEDGFNELPTSKPKRFYHIAFGVLREPMVYLLLGCGLVYFLIGDQQESFMLLGFLGLIIGITIFQEQKAERALEALRDLSSPRAQVLRDGVKLRVAGRDLVREDFIFLNEGDSVPADAELKDIGICIVAGVLSVIWLKVLPTKWTEPGLPNGRKKIISFV